MLDTKEINCFVACVQAGSFSKAAEVLYTTQSSVSKTIKAMEDKMGVILFERLPKGIQPTADAEHMYRYALLILENLHKMQSFEGGKVTETLSMKCYTKVVTGVANEI